MQSHRPTEKLEGVNENIKGEVQRSIGSVLHKYTGSMRKDEIKDEEKLLRKPYLRETRVEYKSVRSMDFPPCLDWEKDVRKLGLWGKIRTKNNYEN